jgi:hypothetical protein
MNFGHVVMPWGRFRGQPLRALSCTYLRWLAGHRFCADLRLAATLELARRRGATNGPVIACPLCGSLLAARHPQGLP